MDPMRSALVLACIAAGGAGAAGCGRIGFAERSGDAQGSSAGDAPGDGSSITRWSHITAYTDATCGLHGGHAYCWGNNSAGQLGTLAGATAARPQLVPLPAGTINDLSLGDSAGCAIVGTDLWCWGAEGTPAPKKVALSAAATHVSAGHGFQCAIAGGAVCWGTNGVGQLGTGNTTTQTVPTAVSQGGAFVAIESGDDHACALDATDNAWCWGHNDYGTLGAGTAMSSSTTPIAQDTATHSLPQIAGWHACALVGAEIHCWGEGDHGELGNGGTTSSSTPVTATGLGPSTAVVTGGGPTDGDASCAISGAQVKCWGNGFYGRLGQGSANPSTTPVAVAGLPAAQPLEVTIGDDHACAALADGSLWCWGRGDLGQLGDGHSTSSLVPVRVADP